MKTLIFLLRGRFKYFTIKYSNIENKARKLVEKMIWFPWNSFEPAIVYTDSAVKKNFQITIFYVKSQLNAINHKDHSESYCLYERLTVKWKQLSDFST